MIKKNIIIRDFIYILIPNSVILRFTPYFLDFKYILNESDSGKKSSKIP